MLFYTKTTTPKVSVPKRKRDTTESTKGKAKVISRVKSKVISRAKKKVKVSKTVNLVDSDEDQGDDDDDDDVINIEGNSVTSQLRGHGKASQRKKRGSRR